LANRSDVTSFGIGALELLEVLVGVLLQPAAKMAAIAIAE
jgi:hypothetical protein